MAKHKRSIWEELLGVGRRILKEVDDLFEPASRPVRQPARVPAPAGKRRQRGDQR